MSIFPVCKPTVSGFEYYWYPLSNGPEKFPVSDNLSLNREIGNG